MKKLLLILPGFFLAGCLATKQMALQTPFPVFDNEAHRGGRGLMPENTIPAMLHAVDLGINTLEMDTHITADSKVVVAHDDHMNPAFMLALGNKEIPVAEAKKYALFQMNYAEISRFDVGLKPYAVFPKQKKMEAGIPLLSDLADAVQLHVKKNGKKQVFYNIETKCDEAGDNLLNPVPQVFVDLLMAVIREKKIEAFTIIQSFDKRTLQVLHKEYPHMRTAYLVADDKNSFEKNLSDLGFIPFIYSPAYKLVDAALVKACHEKGIKIIPWTVNKKAEIDALKSLSVDGIISDYPDLLLPSNQ